MSDHKETIERALASYNRHDAAGFASCFTEDGVLHVVALGEIDKGSEQIQARSEERWRALDYTLEPRGFYECGDVNPGRVLLHACNNTAAPINPDETTLHWVAFEV